MSYQVALIGAGSRSRAHARCWQGMPEVSLTADVFESWEALIAQVKPDIVDICAPTSLHREYVERAAAAGIAIFCEAPIARTLADCDAMAQAVERAGVPFMAGHFVRYSPEFSSARKIVQEGGVGNPATVRTTRLAAFPCVDRHDDTCCDTRESGGVLLDMMLPDFDWLRWCFGEVTRVYAKGLYGQKRFEGRLDYALVTLRFASGVVGHATGSWAHTGGLRTTFEIAGDGGQIQHDSARSVPLSIDVRAKKDTDQPRADFRESPMTPQEDPCYLALRAILDALKSGLPPPITVYDAREALRIALAAQESIETGKVATLR